MTLLDELRYRLVALDLDGTLLNSRKEITPRTRAALQAVQQRGVLTVVATGRTLHSALQWSREIGGGHVLCCNGAGLLDPAGNLILHREIPSAPLEQLLTIARESKAVAECYTPEGMVLDRPLQYARVYLRWLRPGKGLAGAVRALMDAWRRNRVQPVRSLLEWAQRPDRPPVLKVVLFGEPESLRPLAERLQRTLPGLEVSSSEPDNLEITAAGVNKGSGLEQLAARLKVPREAILAIGDSGNDLAMLRYAGMGVAMGSAPDDVKTVADRVTASSDEDGVAQVLEELYRL